MMRLMLQDGPGEAAVDALEHTTETPERLWTRDMALTTADEIADLASAARASQVCASPSIHALCNDNV
jgi:DnaJ family protein C protein 13